MKKEYAFASMFISVGVLILLISSFFLFTNSSNLTGRAIVKEIECLDGEVLLNDKCVPIGTCKNGECNPNNVDEICIGGEWNLCGDGEVCSLGGCVIPANVGGNAFIRGGGVSTDGGSSSGSSGSTQSSSVAIVEVTRTIGEIEGDVIEKIQKDEKLIFLIRGKENYIKLSEIMNIEVDTSVNGNLTSFSVGEEKGFDFDNDGTNDFGIILKSIGLADNSAKFLIKKI